MNGAAGTRGLPARAARLAGALVVAGALVACAGPQVPPLERIDPAPAAAVDPAAPCSRTAASTSTPAEEPDGVEVAYDAARERIVLSGGTGVTLPALAEALDRPEALERTDDGEWLLNATLEIRSEAALRIEAPDVRWLKLRSDADGSFASIVALGGDLTVTGSCITTWDAEAGRVDTDHEDGRSFVLARDGGQMVLDRAELRHLGWGDSESYGLSWREGAGGAITGSVVSHLYFGLYTYEVDGLQVLDNEFHDNIVYGVDPHTGSLNLVIERNVVHHNGKHGIILAEDCTDSVIRDNTVYRNGHHGIVLYQRSDRNVIEDNTSFANAVQGININESSDNTVRANVVYDNTEAGIGLGQDSRGNVVSANTVRNNQQDGIRVVSGASGTELRDNTIGENVRYGVYIDVDGPVTTTSNTVFGNDRGFRLKVADEQLAQTNRMWDNSEDFVVQAG